MLRPSRLLRPDLFVAALFCALMVLSLSLGRYPVSVSEIINIILTTGWNEARPYTDAPCVVVEIVRMPRILAVVLCGMGLAMAGASMQGVFRNPLVGPDIIGVTAGASLGGVLAIMLGWPIEGIVALAFLFGMFALLVAFALAQELPIGLLTAMVGTPVFAVLLWRFGSRGWAND
ncbi:MAG: iron ABC transporter permease [Nitrococcus sp.]|nr:iron ABC transporter permease [Nitrococcus sp.]